LVAGSNPAGPTTTALLASPRTAGANGKNGQSHHPLVAGSNPAGPTTTALLASPRTAGANGKNGQSHHLWSLVRIQLGQTLPLRVVCHAQRVQPAQEKCQ
jgi:hypothetical protein